MSISGDRSYDKFLGGFLADGFDERSCHSRYQSAMYRRRPGRQPSAYLVSKLRQQEALQRRCGPGTVAYSNALEQLRSGCRSGGDMAPFVRVKLDSNWLKNTVRAELL